MVVKRVVKRGRKRLGRSSLLFSLHAPNNGSRRLDHQVTAVLAIAEPLPGGVAHHFIVVGGDELQAARLEGGGAVHVGKEKTEGHRGHR